MEESRYGVKIHLAHSDWIWMTENIGRCMDLIPVLFDSYEEAEVFANIWRLAGAEGNVKVELYAS